MSAASLRRRAGIVAAAALLALVGAMSPAAGQPPLMRWPDLLNRPKPAMKPERLRYGPDSNQVIELWRPATPGPHPVVAMIHGGCWQADVASFHIMDWAAADLAQRGVAVWNFEYRRVDQPGGGYPGTFTDVALALDKLAAEAASRHLTTGNGLVVLGHSAGGHLALWSAGRVGLGRRYALSALPTTANPHPAKVRAVLDLAGIPDLKTDLTTACGNEPIKALLGAPAGERRDLYADTSPTQMLPLGAQLFVIHGAQDTTVEPAVGARFAAKARAAGDTVTVLTPPGGHVEEISPGSAAWEAIATLTVRLAGAAK